jgi:hypothetical protein
MDKRIASHTSTLRDGTCVPPIQITSGFNVTEKTYGPRIPILQLDPTASNNSLGIRQAATNGNDHNQCCYLKTASSAISNRV